MQFNIWLVIIISYRPSYRCTDIKTRVPVSGRPGVENHAGTPTFGMPGVQSEKWTVRRHWTPKNCYLGVLTY